MSAHGQEMKVYGNGRDITDGWGKLLARSLEIKEVVFIRKVSIHDRCLLSKEQVNRRSPIFFFFAQKPS